MPVCSIKGCNEVLDRYPHTEIVLCRKHLAAVIDLLETLRASAMMLMELQEEGRPSQFIRTKRPVTSDAEIRDVIMRYLNRNRRAIVSTILNEYDVDKGDYPTKSARVIAVMKAIMAEDPELVLIPRGVDTILKRRDDVQPEPAQHEDSTT
jgi:hypothetical protein